MNTLVIGIAGGSGSGKTTLANRLVEKFGEDEVTILRHDNYYKAHDDIPFEERENLNYLRLLKEGHSISVPIYDYCLHTRARECIVVHPAPAIVVEGILIFSEPKLCDLMDLKVFVDTDADVRVLRRIKRDVVKRGRSLESVMTQYLSTVKPMHEQFVEPSKRRADLIIPEGGKNLVALEMLIQKVNNHLYQR